MSCLLEKGEDIHVVVLHSLSNLSIFHFSHFSFFFWWKNVNLLCIWKLRFHTWAHFNSIKYLYDCIMCCVWKASHRNKREKLLLKKKNVTIFYYKIFNFNFIAKSWPVLKTIKANTCSTIKCRNHVLNIMLLLYKPTTTKQHTIKINFTLKMMQTKGSFIT